MSDIHGPQNVKGSWDIIGTPDNDSLYGGKGDSRFDGGAGDDTMYPGWMSSENTAYLDGGTGVDTVVFGIGFASAKLEFDAASGTYKIGNLTLKNVEYIDFGDVKLKVEDAANPTGTQHHYTDGDDQLISNDFSYMLEGGHGNDTLTGNGGDDTLYGGKGEDTAVFRGNRADYDIRYDYRSYQYIVTDRQAGRDGSDKVAGIEQLKFADTTIPLHGIDPWGGPPDAATIAKLDGVIEIPPAPPLTDWGSGEVIEIIGNWGPVAINDPVILSDVDYIIEAMPTFFVTANSTTATTLAVTVAAEDALELAITGVPEAAANQLGAMLQFLP